MAVIRPGWHFDPPEYCMSEVDEGSDYCRAHLEAEEAQQDWEVRNT